MRVPDRSCICCKHGRVRESRLLDCNNIKNLRTHDGREIDVLVTPTCVTPSMVCDNFEALDVLDNEREAIIEAYKKMDTTVYPVHLSREGHETIVHEIFPWRARFK